jgi:pimeloyl-ACP methyl ester carboxylesterase
VYVREFARTGLQGGLQWYRSAIDPAHRRSCGCSAAGASTVPACFIAGAPGLGGAPGARGTTRPCRPALADLHGCHLVDGAGHWVQQEQPQAVVAALLGFLQTLGTQAFNR